MKIIVATPGHLGSKNISRLQAVSAAATKPSAGAVVMVPPSGSRGPLHSDASCEAAEVDFDTGIVLLHY